jgi:hypothetical protein
MSSKGADGVDAEYGEGGLGVDLGGGVLGVEDAGEGEGFGVGGCGGDATFVFFVVVGVLLDVILKNVDGTD